LAQNKAFLCHFNGIIKYNKKAKEARFMISLSSRLLSHEYVREELERMGAKVIDVHGTMYMVKFLIKDIKINYIYHINPDNTFFLERTKPYVIPMGDFETEEDILEIIKIDFEQFKIAMHSSNFKEFIEIDTSITNLVRTFEDLFLYYNVSKKDLDEIRSKTEQVLEKIHEAKNSSKRVYFKKEPYSF